MNKNILVLSVFLSLQAFAQVEAATLSCSLREAKFNAEVEKEIDRGVSEVSLFETFKESVEVKDSHAQLRLVAPRSNTVALVNVNARKLNFEISSSALETSLSGTVSQSFTKVVPATYSNFHIESSDVFTNEITLNCLLHE